MSMSSEEFGKALGGKEAGRITPADGGHRWTCECGATACVMIPESERLASLALYHHRSEHHT